MSKVILVIEDDRAISQLLTQTLADDGFTVLTAANGLAALEILDAALPDAIVLDLNMPVMDGRTFMHRLRADQRPGLREIPVLVLTAKRAEQARRELGAQAAIGKPFDIDRVALLLRRMLVHRGHGFEQAASA